MGNKNSGRKPNQERRQLVLVLREQGNTLEEIGRRLGVTRQAVSDMLRRLYPSGTPKESRRETPETVS
jgi:predicted transcriptional regulator